MTPLRALALIAIAATTATATSVASARDQGQGLGTAETRVGFERLETATAATIAGGNGHVEAGLGRYTRPSSP